LNLRMRSVISPHITKHLPEKWVRSFAPHKWPWLRFVEIPVEETGQTADT
jgi:hypothetical protein